jgi:phosphoglycolate phosphatase
MKYKHIIWDWNGTIINDVGLCVSVMNNMLTEHNLPLISEDEYKEKFTFPVFNYYQSLGFSEAQFEMVSHKFIQGYNNNCHDCEIVAGLTTLLEKNQAADVKQSVLSASKQDSLEELISHFGLTQYFEHIAGLSNIYAAGKIDLGKSLMKKLPAVPREVLMVGDTYHDLEVANALGIDHVLVSHGHALVENLGKHTDRIAMSVDDLEKIIFSY